MGLLGAEVATFCKIKHPSLEGGKFAAFGWTSAAGNVK
jgi:hypothetical protein